MDRSEAIHHGSKGIEIRRSSAGLEPYSPSSDNPWDLTRAAHLLRRTQLGPDLYEAGSLIQQDPLDAVDAIVDEAVGTPMPPDPPWLNETPPPRGSSDRERQAYQEQNRAHYVEISVDWYRRLFDEGLRESLALFWSNHFVTEFNVYRAATYAHGYLTLLRTHALGDFKALVREIGLTPAMLIYLDGRENIAAQPNENYARELFELFTMGIGNYTEDDVKEAARALTGWRFNPFTNTVFFNPALHDDGEKTIFGRTGNFGYDDVIDLIFEERPEAVASFVAAKLYRHFVYDHEDVNVVEAMAAILLENDFVVEPVVRTLLKSAHFFDQAFAGAKVKSPAQFMLGLLSDAAIDAELTPGDADIFRIAFRFQEQLGQVLFNPPDVSGWPGYRDWISSASLTGRWTLVQRFGLLGDPQRILDAVTDPSDPWIVAWEVAAHLSPIPFEEEDLESLAESLLDGIPPYEWDPESDGGRARLVNYVGYLMQLPEYQLA